MPQDTGHETIDGRLPIETPGRVGGVAELLRSNEFSDDAGG